MSFWKDLLGDLYVDPNEAKTSLNWSQLSENADNLNINGVSGFSGTPPQKYISNRRAPQEEIAAIIQNRTRAFNAFDINPSLLSASQYAPIVSNADIFGKVGYEDDAYTAGASQIQGWRTVEIASSGTFLKIDFLPASVNLQFNPSGAPNPENYRKPLAYPTQGLGETTFSHAANHCVLIQFDDPKAPLILARHGDSFKIPFERVYVTCKMNLPKFSVITGYNAEILADQSRTAINASLAYGPGHGIWESPHRHCVPFSLSSDYPNSTTGVIQTLNGPATHTKVFFDQEQTNQTVPLGFGVGWITGVNVFLGVALSTTSVSGVFKIGIGNNTFGMRKVLYSVPYLIQATTTGIQRNFIFSKSFPVPIRFVLEVLAAGAAGNFNTQLMVQITNNEAAGNVLNFMYSFEGYSYGNLYNVDDTNALNPKTPVRLEAVTSHPFPLDNLNYVSWS